MPLILPPPRATSSASSLHRPTFWKDVCPLVSSSFPSPAPSWVPQPTAIGACCCQSRELCSLRSFKISHLPSLRALSLLDVPAMHDGVVVPSFLKLCHPQLLRCHLFLPSQSPCWVSQAVQQGAEGRRNRPQTWLLPTSCVRHPYSGVLFCLPSFIHSTTIYGAPTACQTTYVTPRIQTHGLSAFRLHPPPVCSSPAHPPSGRV